jgi:hypothetical protein
MVDLSQRASTPLRRTAPSTSTLATACVHHQVAAESQFARDDSANSQPWRTTDAQFALPLGHSTRVHLCLFDASREHAARYLALPFIREQRNGAAPSDAQQGWRAWPMPSHDERNVTSGDVLSHEGSLLYASTNHRAPRRGAAMRAGGYNVTVSAS